MKTLETKCRHCQGDLDGYVIRGEVMDAGDIVTFFSNRITRETVNTWFARGLLTGHRTRGIRGWWTTVSEFQDDLKKLGRKRPAGASVQRDMKVVRGTEQRP